MTISYKGIQPGRSGKSGESETLVYIFLSDDKEDSALQLFRNKECPRINRKHPTYRWLFCSSLSYTQGSGSNWHKWTVTAEYKYIKLEENEEEPKEEDPPTAKDPGGEKIDDPDDPEEFDSAVHVTIGFEDQQKPISDAFTAHASQTTAFGTPKVHGVPITTSALEPYDPPPEMQAVDPIIDIRVNVPTDSELLNEHFLNALNNLVNQDGFKIQDDQFSLSVPAKCARIRWTLSPKVFSDTPIRQFGKDSKFRTYRELNLQIVVRSSGWRLRLLDIGSYSFDPATPGTIALKDRHLADPIDMSYPHPQATVRRFTDLQGNGTHRLLDGKGNVLPDGEAPVYNEYFVYNEGMYFPLLFKFLNKTDRIWFKLLGE